MKVRKRFVRGKPVWVVDTRQVLKEGGRRHFFPIDQKEVAEKLVAETRWKIDEAPVILTGREKRDFQSAKDILGPDVTLVEAASAWREKREPIQRMTMAGAVNDFIAAKIKTSKDKVYVSNLEQRLGALRDFVGEKIFVHEVTSKMVDDWLHSQTWTDYTKNRVMIDVRTFFNFCRRRSWCEKNPVELIERIEVFEFERGILTPPQAKVFLRAVAKLDPGLVRFFVDQLYGFMRRKEAKFLKREQEMDGYIDFSGAGERRRPSKTGKIRFVPFNDTWLAWRNKFEAQAEYWPIKDFNDRVNAVKHAAQKAMVKAGLVKKDWWFPVNCFRHSACTFGAKKFGASKASEWAGHTEAQQNAHYKRPVTETEAEEYWALPDWHRSKG